MPQFAVITPLYNKAPYVERAIESIVNQSYCDWELVVVDDGSTDGSSEVVERYNDSRIRLFRQPNAGVSAARNRGVALSTAPYLAFLDADDWWEPTFLKEMAALIERHPEAGLYSSRYWLVKNGQRHLAALDIASDFTEGEIDYFRLYANTLCMPLCTGSVCLPREVFDKAGGFPTDVKLGEDFLLWARIALTHKIVILNKPLFCYNQDVDVTFRGTHHLHPPERHFLWHLGDLETSEKTYPALKQLLDNMRTYDLMPYLIDSQYRDAARAELRKVDWKHQPDHARRLYHLPIPFLRLRMNMLTIGSRIKHLIK